MRRRLAILLCVLTVLAPEGARAQEAQGELEVRRYRDWQMARLSPESGCLLFQQVVSRRSGTRLAEILLQKVDGRPTLAVRVPNGAALDYPVTYTIDDRPGIRRMEWISCSAELCLASLDLPDGDLERLRKGLRMSLGYRPLPESRPLVLPVSLRGVSAGWAALEACQR